MTDTNTPTKDSFLHKPVSTNDKMIGFSILVLGIVAFIIIQQLINWAIPEDLKQNIITSYVGAVISTIVWIAAFVLLFVHFAKGSSKPMKRLVWFVLFALYSGVVIGSWFVMMQFFDLASFYSSQLATLT